MIEYTTAVLGGFILLIWGADRFVLGASALARNLGVPPLIIGLTVVGFGTSAPELLVSGMAAWYGNPGIAVGNALGSNIANVALVLGATALFAPIAVHSSTLRREFPILFAVMGFSLLLMVNGYLGRLDGLLLLAGLVFILVWITRLGMKSRPTDPLQTEFEEEIPKKMPTLHAVMWLIFGLFTLLIASRLVVWGASEIARTFGVSDLVIGLTVIAIGTSLPELAASIMSVLKKEDDIAVGNIVGSNMFNLLGVLGLPGLISPFAIPAEAMTRDYIVMFVLTLALFMMSFGLVGQAGRISRTEGGILLGSFFAYLGFLYLQLSGAL
jgi:cation:H+ antiporter